MPVQARSGGWRGCTRRELWVVCMKNQMTSLVARDGRRTSGVLARALLAAGLGMLLMVPLGLGCGDVQILDEPRPGSAPPGPTSETMPSTPAPACEVPDARCNAQYVETCSERSDGQRLWLPSQDCKSAALCVASPVGCQAAACPFGEMRCQGAVPERCSEDLTQREQLGSCPSAAHCSLDAERCAAEGQPTPCCLSNPCAAGELRCNNGQLERCTAALTFDSVVSCTTQKLCELSLDACQANPASCACQPPACEAGSTRCTGAVLERCNADQTDWEPIGEACATEELCQLGRQLAVPACEPASCAPGGFRCTGALLERCNAGQTGFDPVTTCEGGAGFCDSAGGRCSNVPCAIGETRCNGAQIQRCRDDRMGFVDVGDACETAELCQFNAQGAFCEEPACGANEFVCDGTQPRRCNAGRTDFVNVGSACLRDELCSVFRQRCDFCFPSRRECTPDLRFSRTCAPDGNSFGPLTFCPLGCIAGTGACQTCTVGDYSCQGGVLARCNDGFSFSPLNRGNDCSGQNQVSCSGNQVVRTACGAPGCNVQRNVCNQCSGQQRSCADTGSFVTCQANGTFGPPTACGAGLLCAGAGQCACVPGQASCSGDSLLACNATGTALVAAPRCGGAGGNVLRTCDDGELFTSSCASAALCSASTGSSCGVCVDGERSCAAGQPQVCSNGQQVPEPVCEGGFVCQGAGVCACAAGEVRCRAGDLQQCSVDGGSFEPAAACDGAVLRSCNGNNLVSDTCGSADLCVASAGDTCAQCLESDPPSCSGDLSTEQRCQDGVLEETECGPLSLCVDGLGCIP
jgi:hypothetical protein